MTAQHSPAPWTFRKGYLLDADGMAIALTPSIFSNHPAEPHNAALWVAAPAMADALEDLLKDYHADCGKKTCHIERYRQLLAKARGEA